MNPFSLSLLEDTFLFGNSILFKNYFLGYDILSLFSSKLINIFNFLTLSRRSSSSSLGSSFFFSLIMKALGVILFLFLSSISWWLFILISWVINELINHCKGSSIRFFTFWIIMTLTFHCLGKDLKIFMTFCDSSYTFPQGFKSIDDVSEPSKHLNNGILIFHGK